MKKLKRKTTKLQLKQLKDSLMRQTRRNRRKRRNTLTRKNLNYQLRRKSLLCVPIPWDKIVRSILSKEICCWSSLNISGIAGRKRRKNCYTKTSTIRSAYAKIKKRQQNKLSSTSKSASKSLQKLRLLLMKSKMNSFVSIKSLHGNLMLSERKSRKEIST